MMTEKLRHQKQETVYDVFMERGFIEQVTDEEKLRDLLRGRTT